MNIKRLFFIITVLSTLDFVITWIGISKFGFAFEINPLFRSIKAILVTKIGTLSVLGLLIWFVKGVEGQRILKRFLPIAAVIYFAVCVWGVVALKLAQRLV